MPIEELYEEAVTSELKYDTCICVEGQKETPKMTDGLVDGHRLQPDASQLQVCIITTLLTTFICITKKVLATLQSIVV